MNQLHAVVLAKQIERYAGLLQDLMTEVKRDDKMNSEERARIGESLRLAKEILRDCADEIHNDNRHLRDTGSL